jgi:hypothetical protein
MDLTGWLNRRRRRGAEAETETKRVRVKYSDDVEEWRRRFRLNLTPCNVGTETFQDFDVRIITRYPGIRGDNPDAEVMGQTVSRTRDDMIKSFNFHNKSIRNTTAAIELVDDEMSLEYPEYSDRVAKAHKAGQILIDIIPATEREFAVDGFGQPIALSDYELLVREALEAGDYFPFWAADNSRVMKAFRDVGLFVQNIALPHVIGVFRKSIHDAITQAISDPAYEALVPRLMVPTRPGKYRVSLCFPRKFYRAWDMESILSTLIRRETDNKDITQISLDGMEYVSLDGIAFGRLQVSADRQSYQEYHTINPPWNGNEITFAQLAADKVPRRLVNAYLETSGRPYVAIRVASAYSVLDNTWAARDKDLWELPFRAFDTAPGQDANDVQRLAYWRDKQLWKQPNMIFMLTIIGDSLLTNHGFYRSRSPSKFIETLRVPELENRQFFVFNEPKYQKQRIAAGSVTVDTVWYTVNSADEYWAPAGIPSLAELAHALALTHPQNRRKIGVIREAISPGKTDYVGISELIASYGKLKVSAE